MRDSVKKSIIQALSRYRPTATLPVRNLFGLLHTAGGPSLCIDSVDGQEVPGRWCLRPSLTAGPVFAFGQKKHVKSRQGLHGSRPPGVQEAEEL